MCIDEPGWNNGHITLQLGPTKFNINILIM